MIAYKSLRGRIEHNNLHEKKWTKSCCAAAMWLANDHPRAQVFEYLKKHYFWRSSGWWTIVNDGQVSSFESVVFKQLILVEFLFNFA